jgi:hypothetical protein
MQLANRRFTGRGLMRWFGAMQIACLSGLTLEYKGFGGVSGK